MIIFAMETLHQPYSEIMQMDTQFLRGIAVTYAEMHEKEIDHYSDGENTGDCDDEDYDTSMWFQ